MGAALNLEHRKIEELPQLREDAARHVRDEDAQGVDGAAGPMSQSPVVRRARHCCVLAMVDL
jgi:hypothetical protein